MCGVIRRHPGVSSGCTWATLRFRLRLRGLVVVDSSSSVPLGCVGMMCCVCACIDALLSVLSVITPIVVVSVVSVCAIVVVV